MEIRKITSISSGLKTHVQEKKAVWPRYLDNRETHDHLLGKKLSTAVLKIELDKLCVIWSQVQETRYRYAVYEFLEAAYAAVVRYKRIGKNKRLLRKLKELDPLLARIDEPYSAVIHYGTGHSLDSRTRSKWSRILRYAERMNRGRYQLESFIREGGGINASLARSPKTGR